MKNFTTFISMLDELFDKAVAARDNGQDEEAIAIYNEILLQKEDWADVHYNLGLIYKYRTDWERSFHHNRRAIELDPEREAGQWNLGIAATMLKEWRVARTCWNFFGMKYEINDEDTARVQRIGDACIRINPDTDGETVWATRICPARAVLDNIPLPKSNHNFRDIVLNDGAPTGRRKSGDVEYSVFNEIQHLERSLYNTYSIKCGQVNDLQFKLLKELCVASDVPKPV